MAELAAILRIGDDPRIGGFQLALRTLGEDRRRAIESMPIDFPIAPFDESMTKRMRWLESNVLAPIDTLLYALSERTRPYFSEWPGDRRIPTRPDFAEVSEKLAAVHAYAEGLRVALDYQLGMKAPHNSEMRYDIVSNLIDLLAEHFPEVPRTRGQYDKSLRMTVGRMPDFVRRAFQEITGSDERLDAIIQAVVEDERRTQPKRG
jgi:hypothetical protein